MNKLHYTPGPTKVHRQGVIRQLCRPFLSHENGLPEWVKNSAAAYLRDDAAADRRTILIVLQNGKGDAPASISCLDFVGMTGVHVDRDFSEWGDPESATREAPEGVQLGELGGHGHGGKCYMTQMFDDYALLRTVRGGRGCVFGVEGGTFALGWVPNVEEGREFAVPDSQALLRKYLSEVGVSWGNLPESVVNASLDSPSFTLMTGFAPRFYRNRIPHHPLVDSLANHHQMARALQLCDIHLMVNGRPLNNGEPLSLPEIEPMKGFESPKVITVPEALLDPMTDRKCPTQEAGDEPGTLMIYTSAKSMTRGGRNPRRGRHVVDYHVDGGSVGAVGMLALGVSSSFVDYLYCDCSLKSLETYKTNQRGPLVSSPLTRALENWIAKEAADYCRVFENREKRRIRQKDQDEASRLNEWLDSWKNEFLQDFMQQTRGINIVSPPHPPPLPSGTPASIQVNLTHQRAGIGVYFRPSIRFFDSTGQRIRQVPYQWISDDTNVALVDEDLVCVSTFSEGSTQISAELMDRTLKSNKVPLEVLRINGIRIVPNEVEMTAGSRRRFEAICTLPDGSEQSGIFLTWMEDDPKVAQVSASGLVYASNPGKTQVTATDDQCKQDVRANVTVTPAEIRDDDESTGSGFPRVLLSGIDCAPNEDEPPEFSGDHPPVFQRPRDTEENIWWINLSSPFARLYFDADGTYGPRSREWRMYHVERLIDIMVQIALTQVDEESEESLGSIDWLDRAAEYQAQFRQDAIHDLAGFIETGTTLE